MRLPGVKTGRMLWRQVRARLQSGAVILGYHRITRGSTPDPYGITVSAKHFAEHMAVVRRQARPIHLERLLGDMSDGYIQPRTIVVTFDDGYKDSLEIARTVLEEFDIPATVFVTTGYLGREFWWDRLARIVGDRSEQSSELTNKLSELLGDRVETIESPVKRLYQALLESPPDERNQILQELEVTGSSDDPRWVERSIDESEIAKWAGASSLINVGAHSVSHPMLAQLAREDQFREILDSKTHLEEVVGRPVDLFSYPNGSYSRVTQELVQEAGFKGACASHGDVVSKGANRFRLPRFWPKDQDGKSFGAWLTRWLGD